MRYACSMKSDNRTWHTHSFCVYDLSFDSFKTVWVEVNHSQPWKRQRMATASSIVNGVSIPTWIVVWMRDHKHLQGLVVPLVGLVGDLKALLPNTSIHVIEAQQGVYIQHLWTTEQFRDCHHECYCTDSSGPILICITIPKYLYKNLHLETQKCDKDVTFSNFTQN